MVEREPAGEPVLVFGSTCVDVLLRVPHLPRSQEDLQPPGQHFTVGGCAFNAAHAPSRSPTARARWRCRRREARRRTDTAPRDLPFRVRGQSARSLRLSIT